MLNIVTSKATEQNTAFVEKPRADRDDNLAWLDAIAPPKKTVEILLVGGTGPVDFRLRVAQAHARHDLSPSHWSHAALIAPRSGAASAAEVVEVSLEPAGGFGFPVPTNAIQIGKLERYRDPKAYPNIAVVQIACPWEKLEQNLDRLRLQRSALDLPELVLAWLAFAWGAGKTGNPLLDGRGIPSAVMIDALLGAAQLNISPGAVQSANCPELTWQAAKWWQDFYSGGGTDPLSGFYFAPHRLP